MMKFVDDGLKLVSQFSADDETVSLWRYSLVCVRTHLSLTIHSSALASTSELLSVSTRMSSSVAPSSDMASNT